MKADDGKRLKELETGNQRLKQIVADQVNGVRSRPPIVDCSSRTA